MRIAIVVTLALAAAVIGCGKPGESNSKEAGKKVGGAISNFAAGVGQGADNSLMVKVELSSDIEKQGLTKTVAKTTALGEKSITVYFVSKQAFKGTFIAKAMNKDGLEIGRCATDTDLAADDAKYVTFTFPAETDMQLVDKYSVDIRK